MDASQLYYDAQEASSQHDYLRAVDLLQRSIEIADHFKSREVLGQCYERLGDRPGAIGEYRRALELNPRSNKTAHLLASALLDEGDLAAASAIVASLLDRCPTYGPARKLLSTIDSRQSSHG
jgi:tetratricopeptide (TPR) repeat protein